MRTPRPHKTFKRKCQFCQDGVREIDYKYPAAFVKFLTKSGGITTRQSRWSRKKIKNKETGEMVPHPDPGVGKWTGGNGLCRKHQSQLAVAVRRAREMALLPYA